MSVITLKEIVGWFLDSHNYSKSEYRKAYAIAIRGWRKLSWDMTGVVYTETLDVNNDLTVTLPKNFTKERKVGVINHDGEIASLTENNNLSFDISSGAECGVLDFPLPLYRDRGGLGTMVGNASYGIGSNTVIGEYRINKEEGLIYLSPDYCFDTVTIEYLGKPVVDGEYCIDELASEALLSFLRWQWAINDRNVGLGEKLSLKRQWIADRNDAKYRIGKPTTASMNDASRRSVKMGLKG